MTQVCADCRTANREGGKFCLGCGRRLVPVAALKSTPASEGADEWPATQRLPLDFAELQASRNPPPAAPRRAVAATLTASSAARVALPPPPPRPPAGRGSASTGRRSVPGSSGYRNFVLGLLLALVLAAAAGWYWLELRKPEVASVVPESVAVPAVPALLVPGSGASTPASPAPAAPAAASEANAAAAAATPAGSVQPATSSETAAPPSPTSPSESTPAADAPSTSSPAASATPPAKPTAAAARKPRKPATPPAPAAAAPATAPAPEAPPAPAPVAAASPQSQCGDLNFFSRSRCMVSQCARPEFRNHAQCEAVRRQQQIEEEKRNPTY
jgi:hypothetical protein